MCKILIVDDDPDSRSLLEAHLQRDSAEHEVVMISFRNLAIRMIQSHSFKVIISRASILIGAHSEEIDVNGGLALVKAAMDGDMETNVLLISDGLSPTDQKAIALGDNARRVRIVPRPEVAVGELTRWGVLSLS